MILFIKRFLTIRTIIAALVVWAGMCLLTGASIFLMTPPLPVHSITTAVVTVVYMPTNTPVPEATPDHTAGTPGSPVNDGGIHIGNTVQISGTGGEGLRIRSAPGIENNQLFIAKEAEVFTVKDGPVTSGDYTWWYIVSSTETTRGGWAAGNFLVGVN